MHIHPDLFSHLRARVVKKVGQFRRKLPVVMTWDSYVDFERRSIMQGIAMEKQAQIRIERFDRIQQQNKVASQVSEIIDRKGF